MPRDYAYEALAEVTSTDQSVGRGQLNAALRDIKHQTPEIEDSYLLSAEIHERAKMYHAVFPEIALTPTALAKHWQRVKEQAPKRSGANLTAEAPSVLPKPTSREQNLDHARQVLAMLRAEE